MHTDTWYFPGLTVPDMRLMLTAGGLEGSLRVCTPGDGYNDSARANFRTMVSGQSAGYESQSYPQNLSQAPTNQEHQIGAVDGQCLINPESVPVFFACPMSKHDPGRYNAVYYTSCTTRPDMKEFRRVKYEHNTSPKGIPS